jgi:TRAP-type C4-dicarboxylate transport system permease small subunit
MNAAPRSTKVWAVIVLTLCGALYFIWAVIFSLRVIMSARPLMPTDYYAYGPGAAVALFLLFATYAVYCGYRWSLFLFQLVLVFLAFQVLLYLPGLWQAISLGMSSAGRNATDASFWFTMFSPIFMLIAALFCAVVIYREIYSRKDRNKRLQDDAPERRAPEPRR